MHTFSFLIIANVIAQAHTLRKMYRVRQIYRNLFFCFGPFKNAVCGSFVTTPSTTQKKTMPLHFVHKITIFRRSFKLAITCKILLLNC